MVSHQSSDDFKKIEAKITRLQKLRTELLQDAKLPLSKEIVYLQGYQSSLASYFLRNTPNNPFLLLSWSIIAYQSAVSFVTFQSFVNLEAGCILHP